MHFSFLFRRWCWCNFHTTVAENCNSVIVLAKKKKTRVRKMNVSSREWLVGMWTKEGFSFSLRLHSVDKLFDLLGLVFIPTQTCV